MKRFSFPVLPNTSKRLLLTLLISAMSSESNNPATDQNSPSPAEVASSSPETVVPAETSGAPAAEILTEKVAVSARTAPTVTENPPVPVAAPVRKVAIGSQRDAADKTLQPSQPKAVQNAVANPINLTGEPESEPVKKL